MFGFAENETFSDQNQILKPLDNGNLWGKYFDILIHLLYQRKNTVTTDHLLGQLEYVLNKTHENQSDIKTWKV